MMTPLDGTPDAETLETGSSIKTRHLNSNTYFRQCTLLSACLLGTGLLVTLSRGQLSTILTRVPHYLPASLRHVQDCGFARFQHLLSKPKIVGRALAASSEFVTRDGDQIFLSDEPFRFVSFNTPDVHVVEDESWHRVTEFEQTDTLETVKRVGGQVIRIYPFSIVGGLTNGTFTHILGKGKYNEVLFSDLDRLLAIAEQKDIRVIIPLIDNWEWWGGIAQFTALYNGTFRDFYTSPTIKSAWKDFIFYLLNRRNTLTGELYKADPNILAWETGNELNWDNTDEKLPTGAEMDAWVVEMARYMKSLDPNHLVLDGRLYMSRDLSEVALSEESIDMVTDHFYPNTAYSFDDRLSKMIKQSQGRKPFLVGEFGLVMPITVQALLRQVVAAPSVAGALLWSLRSHREEGGFYWHYEYDNYWAYHYPGWETNNKGEEKEVMESMRKYAHEIRGLPVPPTIVPGKPELIGGGNTGVIRWRGAVGAEYYVLEREKKEGSEVWEVVKGGEKLMDAANPFTPFQDRSAMPHMAYRYRIVGVNEAGQGPPSEAVLMDPPKLPAVGEETDVAEISRVMVREKEVKNGASAGLAANRRTAAVTGRVGVMKRMNTKRR